MCEAGSREQGSDFISYDFGAHLHLQKHCSIAMMQAVEGFYLNLGCFQGSAATSTTVELPITILVEVVRVVVN